MPGVVALPASASDESMPTVKVHRSADGAMSSRAVRSADAVAPTKLLAQIDERRASPSVNASLPWSEVTTAKAKEVPRRGGGRWLLVVVLLLVVIGAAAAAGFLLGRRG
jgi:hypothetical protein